MRLDLYLRGRLRHPLHRHFGSVTSGPASLLKLQLRLRHINGLNTADCLTERPSVWGSLSVNAVTP